MTGQVALTDRGLAYGDGLFETLRLAPGAAPLAERHAARMAAGAARLGIPFDADRFWQAVDSLLAPAEEGVGKIILTRGSGGRGYAPPANPQPTWLLQRFPLQRRDPAWYTEGMELGVCVQRLSSNPALAGIKHLNRLEQVLAAGEVATHGWDDGVLLDVDGQPLELTSMNLFARFGSRLWTPDLSRAGVAGVARQWCLEQAAALGLETDHRPLRLSVLRDADEVFACNSVAGCLPVRKLAAWQWRAGETCRVLQTTFDKLF